jgi:glycosyltransferase involved in cell wall biosynthesis
MLSGTPCIASNLPGVRQPVMQTGMGLVAPIGNSYALADSLLHLLGDKERYVRPREEIAARFSTERTAADYEALFAELQRRSPRQVRIR